MAQQFENFDLLIDPAETGYRSRVLASPVGESQATFALPVAPHTLHGYWHTVGRVDSAAADEGLTPESIGSALFGALFRDGVEDCLRRSLDRARQERTGLRIRLRLDDTPELADLPWELLYDAQTERFLFLSRRTQLVRYLAQPEPPPPLSFLPPLQVLLVTASPSDLPRINLEEEHGRLQKALHPHTERRQIELTVLDSPSVQVLQDHLRRRTVHVLHFAGHGYWDDYAEESGIVLSAEDGLALPFSARKLGLLVSDHDPLRLVVLNACETGRPLPADEFRSFPDVGRGLIVRGVPAVIAMQHPIGDRAAADFGRALYSALADGLALDAALAEGRRAVSLSGNEWEWATPVLFSRSPDTFVFQKAEEPSAQQAEPEDDAQPQQGGVNINIATDGGKIENSQISFGDVNG